MFIAMNRFEVVRGSEGEFEGVWRNRESRIANVPGFIEFHLLRGPEAPDHTLYASHTVWRSYADFLAWTKSDAFADAHRTSGSAKGLYRGHPHFEGFEVVSRLAAATGAAA